MSNQVEKQRSMAATNVSIAGDSENVTGPELASLTGQVPRSGPVMPTPLDILEAVSQASGVSLALLLCARRDRKIARPRQLAMYLMRQLCFELSLARIGASVGGRDHKTVMHACDLMDYLLTRDTELKDLETRVLARLYGSPA
jgi:chromosomal replication initiation ATPase DnaA